MRDRSTKKTLPPLITANELAIFLDFHRTTAVRRLEEWEVKKVRTGEKRNSHVLYITEQVLTAIRHNCGDEAAILFRQWLLGETITGRSGDQVQETV